ncbi:MAG: haloalkane dehalogenase [Pikeienuella sp.]|uniref:haloalkane dehalogenase n=1 Tax=Pikeienuella sp. TaxID=2831957 RepID=UPI003919FBAF
MEILRTPDERFAGLPGWSFAPHYVEIAGMRMHYVDEGPRDAPPVLMLHGEPTWSYLYRRMIPLFAGAGFRAVAPDLFGFGRSDKPADRAAYTYLAHVDWLKAFLAALDLRGITLICQDWGGLLGLRLVAEEGDRFARVVAANTFLPTGDEPENPAFLKWLKFSQEVPELPVGGIVQGGTARGISPEIRAAYDAPFPDERFKAGARAFPALVPITPDNPASAANRAAWAALERFEKPFLTAFSDKDAVTAGGEKPFRRRVPGAAGQPHVTIGNAGHFLQEDDGEALAAAALRFMAG